jgi:hypothetical protein
VSEQNFSSPNKTSEPNAESITFDMERARATLIPFDQEREARRQKLRAERPAGRLSDGLQERLNKCNIAQLEQVKSLCKRLIVRQRNPPLDRDCPNQFAVKVIASFRFRNRLYRVELKRTTKRAEKVYVNGPYVYAYRWDGAYVRPEYFGSKHLSKKLPRNVWAALKGHIAGPDVDKLKLQLSEEWSNI